MVLLSIWELLGARDEHAVLLLLTELVPFRCLRKVAMVISQFIVLLDCFKLCPGLTSSTTQARLTIGKRHSECQLVSVPMFQEKVSRHEHWGFGL